MTYPQKVERAESMGITLPPILSTKKNLVGIYYFFACNANEKLCFYIGKSTNIAYRLLNGKNGHIHHFINGKYTREVPCAISEYLQKGYEIEVEIKEINYRDTEFSRAAHRLALAELREIVKYQKLGQCLSQHPEGVGKQEKHFWEMNYQIK